MHTESVGGKKTTFNRKKPPSEPEPGPGRAAICQEGQKRGDNKHHNTRHGIPAEKEKHKLMTAIMSYVHGVQREQREERCIMGGPTAV